ncbi:hypothetical protein AB6A40_006350 [Gnathostoma spinigerum]|uniref:Uncharacterized protein n=1 Tax=Gnathostoma spinigerum TaxID=75299 RepID=A0ABD6EIS5_9BILA
MTPLTIILFFVSFSVVMSRSLHKNSDTDSEQEILDLLDSFAERANKKKNKDRHNKTHRHHHRYEHTKRIPLPLNVDENGREFVVCLKSVGEHLSMPTRCYKPESKDMRVGCYAVWDALNDSLIQDCWAQQEISMNNCQEKRCVAEMGIFCCCYGDECNAKFEISNQITDTS